MTRRRRDRRGFTVLETVLAVLLLSLVVLAGLSMTTASSHYFQGTLGAAQAESSVTYAARLIESELNKARTYQISADGQSISYYNNNTAYPPGQDLTEHRFYRSGTSLMWTGRTRPLLTDVPTTDNGATLVLFAPLGGRASDGNFVTATFLTRRQYTGSGGATRYAEQRALVRVAARNFQP